MTADVPHTSPRRLIHRVLLTKTVSKPQQDMWDLHMHRNAVSIGALIFAKEQGVTGFTPHLLSSSFYLCSKVPLSLAALSFNCRANVVDGFHHAHIKADSNITLN